MTSVHPEVSTLGLNPNAKVTFDRVAGKFPILFVDDFYADPMAVRELALSHEFPHAEGYYPGCHLDGRDICRLMPNLAPQFHRLRQEVALVFSRASGLNIPGDAIETHFSLVTTRPQHCTKHQKHPHFDDHAIRGLVYLTEENLGGTRFYKNVPLDLVAVTSRDDAEAYFRFMTTAPDGPTLEKYEMIFSDLWELIYAVPPKFNRFVSYPGNVFHWIECLHVPEPFDKRLARLTQRFMIG